MLAILRGILICVQPLKSMAQTLLHSLGVLSASPGREGQTDTNTSLQLPDPGGNRHQPGITVPGTR